MKPWLTLGLMLVALAWSGDVLARSKEPVCGTDFDSSDEHRLDETLKRHPLLKVVEGEGVGGSKALKATYRGSDRGSERIVTSFKLPSKLHEATLVFDVNFAEGFQFVKGGKLHGLGPDKPITGGKEVTPDGWSARAMWGKQGLNTYVYCQEKDRKHGQGPDRRHEFEFETDRYYSVSIHVKVNSPAERANGLVRIYVNGTGVAEDRDIQFRSEDGEDTRITRLLFSTFHGGSDESWAPKDKDGNYTDVHAYFDNIAVYKGKHIRRKPVDEVPQHE